MNEFKPKFISNTERGYIGETRLRKRICKKARANITKYAQIADAKWCCK